MQTPPQLTYSLFYGNISSTSILFYKGVPKMFRTKKFLIAISIFILTILTLTSCSKPSSPEEVVEAYQEVINDRDAEELCELIFTNDYDENDIKKAEKFISSRETQFGKEFEIEFEIIEVESNGTKAEVSVEITITNGDDTITENGKIRTKCIDDIWYLIL